MKLPQKIPPRDTEPVCSPCKAEQSAMSSGQWALVLLGSAVMMVFIGVGVGKTLFGRSDAEKKEASSHKLVKFNQDAEWTTAQDVGDMRREIGFLRNELNKRLPDECPNCAVCSTRAGAGVFRYCTGCDEMLLSHPRLPDGRPWASWKEQWCRCRGTVDVCSRDGKLYCKKCDRRIRE